jgi:hypothetical protein
MHAGWRIPAENTLTALTETAIRRHLSPPPSAKTITPLNQLASAVGEYSPRLLQAEEIVPTSRDELGIDRSTRTALHLNCGEWLGYPTPPPLSE